METIYRTSIDELTPGVLLQDLLAEWYQKRTMEVQSFHRYGAIIECFQAWLTSRKLDLSQPVTQAHLDDLQQYVSKYSMEGLRVVLLEANSLQEHENRVADSLRTQDEQTEQLRRIHKELAEQLDQPPQTAEQKGE